MGKNTKKTVRYRRRQSEIRETRRQFLLAFFDKGNQEKYVEKELNGFLMVRSFDKQRDLFVVRVYSSEESILFKVWLKEFLEEIR